MDSTEVKAEVKAQPEPEIKKEVEVKKTTDSSTSVFITENDTFDINVEFYKDKGKMLVKDVDADFDITRKLEPLKVTFKYPSQGDADLIFNMAKQSAGFNTTDSITAQDYMKLEIARVMILIRSWSISDELTAEKIYQLHPKIVKAITFQMRSELGAEGII